MASLKWLLTVGFLLATLPPGPFNGQAAADPLPADALRAWCYSMGSVHSDDSADPSLFGIPNGPCRESYDAGRIFTQKETKRSAALLDQMGANLKDSCRDALALIANAERKGQYDHAADLKAMASTCYH